MTWFVEVLKKKDSEIWHLCATSDEGGGFAAGCAHDHATAAEAQACIDARKEIGTVTGFPLQMDRITINEVEHDWPHDDPLSHETICGLAGQPLHASVVYFGRRIGDSERSGTTYAGKSIKSDDGLRISCVVTGSA